MSYPDLQSIASSALRWCLRLLVVCCFGLMAGPMVAVVRGAEKEPARAEQVTAAEGVPGGEHAAPHEGLTPHAPLIDLGIFKVTNSMIVTWIVALGIIIFAQYATREIKQVPEGAQNFWEWLVESLHNFLESIIGHDLVKKTFWFFATLFIFILFTNWAGLIPGVGTVGWGVRGQRGFQVTRPLLRGGTG